MSKNLYLSQFYSDLKSRYPVDGANMSYADWLIANTTLNSRPFGFNNFQFQVDIVNDMAADLTVIKPSQVGMALALETPVPTPTGWTTMGSVKEGDRVIDEQGKPCTVTYVSPIYTDHPCYEITFDTGETIIADENHRWYVEALSPFSGEEIHRLPGRAPKGFAKEGVLRTKFLAETFKRGVRNVYAIPNTQPIETPKADLPVDPYFLGLWLGDGNTHASVLTGTMADMEFYATTLADRGIEARFSSNKEGVVQYTFDLVRNRSLCPRGHDKDVVGRTTVGACKRCAKQNSGYEDREESVPYDTLPRRLNQLGLLGQRKHIPPEYFRASTQQRLELLQGLLDTDGSITKRGRISFHNTSRDLIAGVEELIHSLGWKSFTRWRGPSESSPIKSKLNCAEVSFVAYEDTPTFKLPRKLERLRSAQDSRTTETRRRRIVDIKPVAAVPVRCIAVDSPKHLFLAGVGMIPTHNTEVQIRKFLAFLARHRGTSGIFTFPNMTMFQRNSKTRIRPIVAQRAFANTGIDDERPSRSMNLYEINGSFAHIMGMTEGEATSTPADILFHDELDLSPSANIALFQSRLQNSDFRITQKFSTPTHPGFGIDASFSVSDKRAFLCKCKACNHWQDPIFSMDFLHLPGYELDGKLEELDVDTVAGIDLENSYFKCERCSARLDLGNADCREWVPEHPARRAHGYRIRPSSTSRLGPAYIIDQLLKMKTLDNLKGWYNTVLGETYSDGSSKLEPDVVKAIMKGPGIPEVGDSPVALAADMGKTCHLVMGVISGDEVHPFLFEQVPSEEIEARISQLCDRYNVVAGGVDRHPYTPTANRISEATNRIILPIEYRGSNHVHLVKDEYDNLDFVQINRTSAIDSAVRATQRQTWSLQGYGAHGNMVVEHMCDMVRIEADEKPATWEKLTGADHFMHALVLLRASIKIRQLILMTTVTENRTLLGLIGVKSQPTRNLAAIPRGRAAERVI